MANPGYRDYHRVQIHDPGSAWVAKFGDYGTTDGKFVYPFRPVFDTDGHVYVPDQTRVQRFSLAGGWQKTYTFPCPADRSLTVCGAAFDTTRNLLHALTRCWKNSYANNQLTYYEVNPDTGAIQLTLSLNIGPGTTVYPAKWYDMRLGGGLAFAGGEIFTAGMEYWRSWMGSSLRAAVLSWDFSGNLMRSAPLDYAGDLHGEGGELRLVTDRDYRTFTPATNIAAVITNKPTQNPPYDVLSSGIQLGGQYVFTGRTGPVLGTYSPGRVWNCGIYQSGSLWKGFGPHGSGDGQYGWAFAVSEAPNGNLYIADWNELPLPEDGRGMHAPIDPLFGFHYAVWRKSGMGIVFSRSYIGQDNWTAPVLVSALGHGPSLIIHPDRLLEVVMEYSGSVVHRYSRDFGRTWEVS